MRTIESKAQELGYQIEAVSPDNGRFLRAIRVGNLIYTSGHLPIGGERDYFGKVGSDLTLEEGYEAAKLATLGCLSAIKGLIGPLDNIKQVVKVMGMVNVAPGFHDTSSVIDGCTHLLRELLGDAGNHTRSAVGMVIPRNMAVEIEMIVEVD
jgi:enamine deaminase RidA (YjgF/YER057c/UK114 family)